MIKGTPELIAERRDTILNACETLYRTMGFKEITLSQIGALVPFSRPTIYNYFRTKEEIFLGLFAREYDRWNAELSSILNSRESMTAEEFSGAVAGSLERRPQLLKLLSMNNYDMEAESRLEMLTSFKASYGESLRLFGRLLEKFFPGMTDAEIHRVTYAFFPFMFGIYPYTSVTEKQRSAMAGASVPFAYHSVYGITRELLLLLLRESAR